MLFNIMHITSKQREFEIFVPTILRVASLGIFNLGDGQRSSISGLNVPLRYVTLRYFALQFAALPLYLTPFPLHVR